MLHRTVDDEEEELKEMSEMKMASVAQNRLDLRRSDSPTAFFAPQYLSK